MGSVVVHIYLGHGVDCLHLLFTVFALIYFERSEFLIDTPPKKVRVCSTNLGFSVGYVTNLGFSVGYVLCTYYVRMYLVSAGRNHIM